jgi:hypothetical protein
MDVLVPEVDKLGPVLIVLRQIPNLDFVNEGVASLLADKGLGLRCLVWQDIVIGQSIVNHPEPYGDSVVVV